MTDKRIEFGTTLRSVYNIAQLAKQIEDLGYDFLGCGEHVSFHGETGHASHYQCLGEMVAPRMVPHWPRWGWRRRASGRPEAETVEHLSTHM